MWHRADQDVTFFECYWKPNCSEETRRFIAIGSLEATQRKGPLQLKRFAPYEYGCPFKVILTNATLAARALPPLHHGPGAREATFAELKSETQMDYLPCRGRATDPAWLLAAITAHTPNRELQISTEEPAHSSTEQRASGWAFVRLGTRRGRLIHRAVG